MPELPDLELYRANLEKEFKGCELENIATIKTKRSNASEVELNSALVGKVLINISRVGKELSFNFEDGISFAIHLMLKGTFEVVFDYSAVRNGRVSLCFKEKHHLVIADPQGFASFTLSPQFSTVPDALGDDFTIEYFREVLQSEKSAIKGILVNQKLVQGIGNAYADEILYHSKIHPETIGKLIPADEVEKLYKAITVTLNSAIQNLRKMTPNAISGEERGFLLVHRKDISETSTGFPIQIKKIASKKTYFTDEQRLFQ